MIRKIFLLILGFLLYCSAAIPAPAPQGGAIQIPPYSTHTLRNGLKVVLMEYHRLPLVEVQLTVGGGTSTGPDSLEGLADMTAELLKQGTTTRTATQIADQIDFIGATLETGADADFFSVSGEFLKKYADTGLDLISDVVLHPTFPQEELDRSRSQRLASIEQMKESPRAIAGVSFTKMLYGPHPYGRQTNGTNMSLPKITRDELVQFYRRAFVPNNSLLVAVGDFSTSEMLDRITKRFEGWESGALPDIQAARPEFHTGRRIVLVSKPDVTQTQIRIGNTGIDIANPDRIAINVANTIFGGGFTSRLVNEIRVKNSLTYNISSGFSALRLGGAYLISTFTKNETVRRTIDLTLAEIKKLREGGVTGEELAKAKNYIAGSFARSLQAPEDLTSRLSSAIFYGFPEEYLPTYVEKVKSVSVADVKRVVAKYFQYDDLLLVLVTNPKEVRPQLEGLGTIEEIPLEKAIE